MASSQDLLSFLWLSYFCSYYFMIYHRKHSLVGINDRIHLGLISLALGVMTYIFIKLNFVALANQAIYFAVFVVIFLGLLSLVERNIKIIDFGLRIKSSSVPD